MKHFSLTPFGTVSNSGYTIIEVLVALAIFSIGLMAMGLLQAASLKSTGSVSARSQAWAILDDQAEALKSMPFYANDNDLDDDSDGSKDEIMEEMPELVAGNHSVNQLNGLYTVNWRVENDQPIPAVVMPPPAVTDPVLPEVPAGTYTVSKTVSVWVTRQGSNDILADVQFVKTWAEDGIP